MKMVKKEYFIIPNHGAKKQKNHKFSMFNKIYFPYQDKEFLCFFLNQRKIIDFVKLFFQGVHVVLELNSTFQNYVYSDFYVEPEYIFVKKTIDHNLNFFLDMLYTVL